MIILLPVSQFGPKYRKAAADRTRSYRHRAGSRRNKRLRNVPKFKSDFRSVKS